MDPVALTLGLCTTSLGCLLVGLAVPLMRGRVKPNALYGIRFRESFRSADAWYAINRFGGRRMATWAVPVIAIGIASFFLPLKSHTGMAMVVALIPILFVLIPVLESLRFARRYGRTA